MARIHRIGALVLGAALLAGVASTAAAQSVSCERVLATTRDELGRRFSDPDDPGLHQRRVRLRELYAEAGPFCARRLRETLGDSDTGDALSALFHGRLAGATRRELLAALDARAAEALVHVRRSVDALGPVQVESLRRGVAAMKARPDTDPTSWIYQANIHGTVTTPARDAWNSCQHGNYFFLSWHRMYLHYFERILREASGDPDLALPYWNYSDAAQRSLPLPFRDPADATNPLYVAERQVNGGEAAPESATAFDRALARVRFTASGALPSRSSFGGRFVAAPRHFGSGGGELESQPHNVMHVVIGGPGGWMSDPRLAARDPIFWLHHANVDRLWKRWLARGGGRANPESDAGWMGTSFRFFDEKGAAVDATGAEILDTAAQLAYRYDDDPVVGRAAPEAPRPRAGGEPERGLGERLAARDDVTLGARRVDVGLELGPDAGAQLSAAFEREAALLLNAEGIDYDENPGIYWEIYLNLAESDAPDSRSPSYVGNLAVFAQLAHGAHGDATLSYDVTRTASALRAAEAWDARRVGVTFVPRAVVDAESGADLLPADVPALRIRRLSLSIQEPEGFPVARAGR